MNAEQESQEQQSKSAEEAEKEARRKEAEASETNPRGRYAPKGYSGEQNKLAQKQREASKNPREVAPGKIEDAIISEKGIAYSKDKKNLGEDDSKSEE